MCDIFYYWINYNNEKTYKLAYRRACIESVEALLMFGNVKQAWVFILFIFLIL